MFDLFSKGAAPLPDWHTEMQETQQRWQIFLVKLEEKMQELCEAAIPELQQSAREDSDPYKRTHGRMLAGVKGQLSHMRDKARTVHEEKIDGFFDAYSDDANPVFSRLLYEFRNECREQERQFEEKYWAWMNRLDQTGERDLELDYQHILAEYAAIKDSFACRQCGSPISIEKIYFLTSYLPCPHCQTSNTFEPSTQARQLEALGRSLAEQRTAHLLAAYEAEKHKERTLYQQIHENRLRANDDASTQKQRAALLAELEQARRDAIARAPALYEIWLRAMFDEWNSIVPDLSEHNERFYQRMLGDFRNSL